MDLRYTAMTEQRTVECAECGKTQQADARDKPHGASWPSVFHRLGWISNRQRGWLCGDCARTTPNPPRRKEDR